MSRWEYSSDLTYAEMMDSYHRHEHETPEDHANDFGALFAKSDMGDYDYDEYKDNTSLSHHLNEHDYAEAYLAAYRGDFETGDGGYYDVRYSGGSPELYEWLVEINEFMTAEEYEERYGTSD